MVGKILIYRLGLIAISGLLTAPSLLAQNKTVDLFHLAQTGGLVVQNRTIAPLTDGSRKGISFSAAEGDGVAWIKGIGFSHGSIELDIRGKDVLQQSFVGVAFHGINKDSLESVYFRPFNFRSTDSVRKTHAVQYIDQPDFPWERLRSEHTGIFEKAIYPPPAADQWFHVRITVHYPEIKVYVNNNTRPSLTVKELSSLKDGRIGLWVGNNSDGDFANLVIDDH
jgi:hypothetical protein